MTDSNQDKDLGVLQKIQKSLVNTAVRVSGMVVTTRCPRCHSTVLMTDRDGDCDNHKPVPAKVAAHINFVESPEPRKPWYSALDQKKDEGQPVRLNPKITPEKEQEKSPALTNARVRTDGGKSRKDYATLSGERDPFIEAQIRNLHNYEPNIRDGVGGEIEELEEIVDVPTYYWGE